MPQIANLGNALADILTHLESDEPLEHLGLPRGSMNLISEEKFHELEDFLQNSPIETATGGSAANTALCLSHLSQRKEGPLSEPICRASYISRLNPTDRYGRFFIQTLSAAGVELPVIETTDTPSGACLAFVSPDGERTFATYLGAAAGMEAGMLRAEMMEGADIVHIEGYLVENHALMLRAIELAHQAGARVSLDMASYNVVAAHHDFFAQILPEVDIVFANEEEALAWKPGTVEEALASLASLCEVAVVKVGARGAYAQQGEEVAFCPAERVAHVVDTTAAGDFFAAGFLYALSMGRPLDRCLHDGAYCASKVIQVMGTKLTLEMWADLHITTNAQPQ